MKRRQFLCGWVVLLFELLSVAGISAVGLGIVAGGGYSTGNDFSSGLVSVKYLNPDFLNFGLDAHLYNYTPNDVTTRSYLGFAYIDDRLLTKNMLRVDWLAGISSAQTKYSTYKTDWSTTPGLGLEGNYEISKKWSARAKAVGIIYSDGYSLLYQAGPEYKYKKWVAGIGIDGITSVSTGTGQTSTPSNNLGGMLAVGYVF